MRHIPALAALSVGMALVSPSAALTLGGGSNYWGTVVGYSLDLVGRDLNGTALNGDLLDGRRVTGVSLEGATLDGEPLGQVELSESSFSGTDAAGHPVKGNDFVGATFEARLDDGQALTLHVAARVRHAAHHDVYGYEVWYGTQDNLEPLCGRDADGAAALAIPLRGRWSFESGVPGGGAHIDDPTSFTFACDGYAVAKCVVAGYKPWARTLTCSKGKGGCVKGTLAAHHQACTRALRADYFGDGTAHTEDGTVVNLYDGYGVRTDSEDWPVEAEWDAGGAVCVKDPRLSGMDDLLAPLYAPDCGDVAFFQDGTLLMTEAP